MFKLSEKVRTHSPLKSTNIYGFAWQYGVSLLNGAATFFTLSWLSHLLANPTFYSQVSSILSLYVVYAAFLDLGSSGEYFRLQGATAAPNPDQSPALPLLLTRLLFSVIILFVGVMHCQFASLDGPQTVAVLLLLASLLPVAILSSFDTMLLSMGRNNLAITAKLVRVGATLTLPLTAALAKAPTLPLLFSIYFIQTSALAIGCAALLFHWRPELRPLLRTKDLLMRTKLFLVNLTKPGVTSIIVVLASILFSMFLFRDVGITNLATYVVVQSLFSPISTAAQTLNTLSQRRLNGLAQSFESTRRELIRITTLHWTVFLIGGAGLIVAKMAGLVDLFFRHLDASFLPLVLLGVFAYALGAAAVPFAFILQIRSQRRLFFLCQVLPFTAGGVLLFFLSREYGLWGNITTFLGIQATQFAALSWAALRKAPSPQKSSPTY